jgi:BirA family biotin operon repressor/biotin-[acetyl-CoA-carboxylase] ligase
MPLSVCQDAAVPGPPTALTRSLVDGPSVLSGLEWHESVSSTNALAAAAADRGVPEVHAVLADVQTAGRGRRGRRWEAPAGTSLLLSLVLRPRAAPDRRGLLPLVAGLATAEAVAPFCPGATTTVKWPNDVLVAGCKVAGVLGQAAGAAGVLGIGHNLDWRAVARPDALAGATSLAEEAGRPVDRWRVLAALVGVFGNRYSGWAEEPGAVLDAYRARCATIGAPVRVGRTGRAPLEGTATGVSADGTLTVRTAAGAAITVSAGDVEHVRSADAG